MGLDVTLVVTAWICAGVACAVGIRTPARAWQAPPLAAFVALTVDGLALGMLATRRATESTTIWSAVALAVALASMMAAIEAADRRRRDDEGGSDGPPRDDGPPRGRGPTPDPDWWPQFERDLQAYVRRRPAGARVGARHG